MANAPFPLANDLTRSEPPSAHPNPNLAFSSPNELPANPIPPLAQSALSRLKLPVKFPGMKNIRPAARTLFQAITLMTALCALRPPARAVAPVETAPANAMASQLFFCSAGYNPADCLLHAATLKAVLHQYPAPQLGSWSWVIVRSEDWQPLLRRLRLDQRSPAFSALDQRSTYLDEVLFRSEPKRTAELQGLFHISTEQLLPMAITHELGHAVCQEKDEDAANRIADQLRNGEPVDCLRARGLTQVQQLYLHRRSPGLLH